MKVREPTTLLKFLREMTENRFSVRELKSALEQNRCTVNGAPERFGSRKLYKGDEVSLAAFTKEDVERQRFEYEEQRVIYEDDAILVYDKPVGIPSIDNGLFELLKKEKETLFPIHRLDKDTSGVIIFAKTPTEEAKLLKAFKERSVQKTYLGLVQGRLEGQGTIDNFLGKVGEYQGQTIMRAVPGGQRAITNWTVLKAQKDASLVELKPKTGRTHQLRSHMASIQHPLIGDVQYGWKKSGSFAPKSFFLHSSTLEFKDGGFFTAPLPTLFTEAIEIFFGSP